MSESHHPIRNIYEIRNATPREAATLVKAFRSSIGKEVRAVNPNEIQKDNYEYITLFYKPSIGQSKVVPLFKESQAVY